jgi:hypothetical protein
MHDGRYNHDGGTFASTIEADEHSDGEPCCDVMAGRFGEDEEACRQTSSSAFGPVRRFVTGAAGGYSMMGRIATLELHHHSSTQGLKFQMRRSNRSPIKASQNGICVDGRPGIDDRTILDQHFDHPPISQHSDGCSLPHFTCEF